jgi:hypothetical protein
MSTRFRIVTCIPAPYAAAARRFLPSWLRNAGAAEIRIGTLPACDHRAYQLQRWPWLTAQVQAGVADGVRVLWLDSDCFVLRELGPGFAPHRPIGVARWPRINAGVLFFNTDVAFDFAGWCAATGRDIETMLRDPAACDQWALEHALLRIPDQIHRLDWREWNYCDGDDWPRELRAVQDTVRIIHVKGLGDWDGPFAAARIAAVHAVCGERL